MGSVSKSIQMTLKDAESWLVVCSFIPSLIRLLILGKIMVGISVTLTVWPMVARNNLSSYG